MRNEKGITLVALILIIVVLLILAGISIMLVVNNETEEKPSNQSLNKIEYDSQLFENAYNEYTDTLEDETENTVQDNNTVENETDINSVDTNTVSNTTELELTNDTVQNNV